MMTVKDMATAAKTLKTKYGMTCTVVGKETDLTHDDWLKHRKLGIGGSEIAAIMGKSKWGSPLTVWMDKKGLSDPSEQTEQQEEGSEIEDYIATRAKQFLAKADPEGQIINCHYMLESKEGCFPARANLDRLIKFRGKWGVYEIKNVIEYAAGEWEAGVWGKGGTAPEYYYYQLMWYLYITGLKFGFLHALVGGRKHIRIRIDYDQGAVDEMIETARKFWNTNILAGERPSPIQGIDFEAMDELLLTKEALPNEIHDDELMVARAVEYNSLKKQIKTLDNMRKVLGGKIKDDLLKKEASKIFKDGEKLVNLIRVKGRTTFNSKKFAADNPETFAKYAKTGEPTFQMR